MMGYQKAQRGLACVHRGPSLGGVVFADRWRATWLMPWIQILVHARSWCRGLSYDMVEPLDSNGMEDTGQTSRGDCCRPPVAASCGQQILKPVEFLEFARHPKLVAGLYEVWR